MSEDDLSYYQRRYQQETLSEQAASSVEAASVHRALALIYAGEVRRLSPPPPLRIVRSGRPAAAASRKRQISEQI